MRQEEELGDPTFNACILSVYMSNSTLSMQREEALLSCLVTDPLSIVITA